MEVPSRCACVLPRHLEVRLDRLGGEREREGDVEPGDLVDQPLFPRIVRVFPLEGVPPRGQAAVVTLAAVDHRPGEAEFEVPAGAGRETHAEEERVLDGAVRLEAREEQVVLDVPEEGEEAGDGDGYRVVEADAGVALGVVGEDEGAEAAGAVPGGDLADLEGGGRNAGLDGGLADAGAVVAGFAEEGGDRGVGGNVRGGLLAGEDREAAGDALGRGDAAFVGAGLAPLVRFEGGGAADQEGRFRRGGNPPGELGVEAGPLGGGVVVEGGADGGDGVRARVGEKAREPAHRVQLVDGEVDFPLAGEEEVGGAGGRGGDGGGDDDRGGAGEQDAGRGRKTLRRRGANTPWNRHLPGTQPAAGSPRIRSHRPPLPGRVSPGSMEVFGTSRFRGAELQGAGRLPPMRRPGSSETGADTAIPSLARDTVSICIVQQGTPSPIFTPEREAAQLIVPAILSRW